VHRAAASGKRRLGTPRPDYYVFFDGDIGIEAQHGYYHQELNNGMVYPADSTHFVLPQGAVCGFHHTGNSPGRTCMGFNPSRAFADILTAGGATLSVSGARAPAAGVTAGARGYLCDADPGVFSGVAMHRIRPCRR
jgi:hypothetical protein